MYTQYIVSLSYAFLPFCLFGAAVSYGHCVCSASSKYPEGRGERALLRREAGKKRKEVQDREMDQGQKYRWEGCGSNHKV